MKHPEVFLIPVFSLADYFLTLVGAVLREKKFGHHFKTELYELNPVWQSVIAEKKWFNPKHLLLTIIETSALVFVIEFGDIPETFVEIVLGFFLVGNGILVGRHLDNILTFWHVIRKPGEISGQVSITHALVLSMSMYKQVVVAVPLILILLFAPSPFMVGATLVCVLQMLMHLIWIWKFKKKQKKK